MAGIEDFEKSKEVKSFVATGPPLMQPYVIEATHAARAKHAEALAVEARAAARARTEPTADGERVELSEAVVATATGAQPRFDPYQSDVWGKREDVLAALQLAVRTKVLRARVDRRIHTVKASLGRMGISLTDKATVRALVLSRSKGGTPGGGGADGGGGSSASGRPGSTGGYGLSMAGIVRFTFPEAPLGGGPAQGDPLAVLPIEPFDETKLFALRVPRRYVQMDYQKGKLTAPGAFPPIVDGKPLRLGAAFESGRPLPEGSPNPVPETWGLPQQLLLPPPRPPPETLDDLMAKLAETKKFEEEATAAAAATDDAPPAKDDDDDDDDDEDSDVDDDAGGDIRGSKEKLPPAPPLMPLLAPRVCTQPPMCVETDARQKLRPMPLRCNEYWRVEPLGLSSAIVLLSETTLSTRWRAQTEPWADALAPLPALMDRPVGADTAAELSEDESDTEIDPSLLFPPSLAALKDVFDLPTLPDLAPAPAAAPATDAPAAADAPPADAPPADAAEPEPEPEPVPPAIAAVAAVDDGEVAIAPERYLAVDAYSEQARAEGQLDGERRATRRANRLRLRERFAMLNELIEQPRHQLSLS